MLIVPGLAMWLDLDSMFPSGTNFTSGAHSAFPSLRAIASQFVRFT
jgi:hypothetical protein